MHHKTEVVKHVGDVAAAGITVGTIAQILPSIAAVLTIIWTGIRIWEMDTVQKLFRKKK